MAAQEGSDGLARRSWEVVVVANACTDRTALAASEAWRTAGGDAAALRVIEEPRPGLLAARAAAVAAARGNVLAFVDDDNELDPGYLAAAAAFLEARPEAAAVGGESRVPDALEAELPPWFRRFARCYAVGRQHDRAGDVSGEAFPLWGAGLCLRTAALHRAAAAGFEPVLTGRLGGRSLAGDDTELCLALVRLGWALHHEPRLTLVHRLDPTRLTWPRCLEQNRGFGAASPVLDLHRHLRRGGPRAAGKWGVALARAARAVATAASPRPAEDAEAPEDPAEQDLQMAAAWARGRLDGLLAGRVRFFRAAAVIRRLDSTPASGAAPCRSIPVPPPGTLCHA